MTSMRVESEGMLFSRAARLERRCLAADALLRRVIVQFGELMPARLNDPHKALKADLIDEIRKHVMEKRELQPELKPSDTLTPRTEAFAESCVTYQLIKDRVKSGQKAGLDGVEFVLAIEHARNLEREIHGLNRLLGEVQTPDKCPAFESQLCPGEDQRECGPPHGPGQPPRDERPSAECQMLREQLAAKDAEIARLRDCRRGRMHPSWREKSREELLDALEFQGAMTAALSDSQNEDHELIVNLRARAESVEADLAALRSAGVTAGALVALPPPNMPAVPLTRDCTPGQLVTWQNVLGWTFTGTLKEWDNGTAMIEWPMIQTPLVAVQMAGAFQYIPSVDDHAWCEKKK